MTLLERIKADQLVARKAGDTVAKDLLTTLIGDVQNALLLTDEQKIGKFKTSDVSAITELTVKSFLKNIADFQSKTSEEATLLRLRQEQHILEGYLPRQLTETQIKQILFEHMGGKFDKSSKGVCMKYLKDRYANQYDGKVAGQVVDALIASNA